MSSLGNHINSTLHHPHNRSGGALLINGFHTLPPRSRTPNAPHDDFNTSQLGNLADVEIAAEDDSKTALFNTLYAQSESRIGHLFSKDTGDIIFDVPSAIDVAKEDNEAPKGDQQGQPKPAPKKAARTIDEDDYDDSEDEDEDTAPIVSPLKFKSTGATTIPRFSPSTKIIGIPLSPALTNAQGPTSQWQGKTSEDARKKLEMDKQAAEDAAKRSFHKLFYPIDNDRDAMLEQQRLEESDRQVDVEMSGHANTAANNVTEGTLSQANLGASSLVLKHLIARIDAKREKVKASDQELRNLMIEVKKNRSKWASEDRVGQEELYEAAEKVLVEVKAMTEHSQPFLQKVNKREAPDYYNVIKHPMDLSTMTKKLKAVQYKSKQEFVEDLNLIWANCLKYNANPEHFLRRHALYMRKETEKLIPLIPEIVIRDRAEVEAEERRLHNADGDIDGAEDSDDEPIISSRGRKAPGKKAKKGSNARKAPPGALEGTLAAESKPMLHSNGSAANLRHDFLRADSDVAMEGSQTGLSTPPPGTITPAGFNGLGNNAASSQVDPMDVDGFGATTNGVGPLVGHAVDYDDPEYKTWKQVTKRDRALVATERHRLFKGDHLNPDEPALLRSKAGMRRWLRKQREADVDGPLGKRKREMDDEGEKEPSGETLAEGMEGTQDRVLPDYYDPLAAIPELPSQLQWVEDSEGFVMPTSGEYLRIVPQGLFTAPQSAFAKKMQANMKQMQDTRKVCTKIGVVRQMQLQSQMYQNQFQKYDPEPFVEQDIEPTAVSDDGPIISAPVSRAAMQRSVAEIFYHAGFEEFQPSALEAMTDLAGDYFTKLARSLNEYMLNPKVAVKVPVPGTSEKKVKWVPKYTQEESILQCLEDNRMDLESLESYVREDVDRLTGKFGNLHERMKAHLADLLRPALAPDAGPDGVNAFNDGSDQFVGGDFAEDLDEDFFGFKELGLDKEFGLASLSVPLHLLQNRMHNAYQAQNTTTIAAMALTMPAPEPYPPVTVESINNEIGLIHEFFLNKLRTNNNQPLVEDEDLPQKQRFPKPRLPPTGKISSPRKKPIREPGPGKGHPRKKMRMIEGEGWVPVKDVEAKDSKDKDKDKDPSKTGPSPSKPGSKLRNGVSATAMERSESRDADGDVDDGGLPSDRKTNGTMTTVPGEKDKLAAKKKAAAAANGVGAVTVNSDIAGGEGGMISPESLEAAA